MRVLFVYPNILKPFQMQMGVGYISAVLEEAGHKTKLLDATLGSIEKNTREVMKFKPDIVAFSVRSFEMSFAESILKEIRAIDEPYIVFGGPHATVAPKHVLSKPDIDSVCIGEGEYAMLELVDKMEKGKKIENIRNFWFSDGNNIIKNPLRPLTKDLDSIPFPNRDLFDKRHVEMNYPGSPILTTRGCPFDCSYCINAYLKKIYGGIGYTRFRTADNVIEEILQIKRKYNIEYLWFTDDTFTLGKKRLLEFCEKYKDEIDLKFRCMARVETIDREILTALKEAGCVSIHMGIETGDEKLRKEILYRNISDKQIKKAFILAHEIGLKTQSYNMIGIPFETEENIMKGIALNKELDVDNIQTTTLYPFMGTHMRKLCVEKKFLTRDFELTSDEERISSYYEDTVLNLPGISRGDIIFFSRFFQLYAKSPLSLYPFLNILKRFYKIFINTRFQKLFDSIYKSYNHRVISNFKEW